MLRCVVAANGAVDEGTWKCIWIGDVQEVRNVKGRRGQAVEDTDCPAVPRKTPVPGADVAPRVGVHMCVARVPEEPDIFLICDGLGMKEIVINLGIRAQVKELIGDGVEPGWKRVVLGIHRV